MPSKEKLHEIEVRKETSCETEGGEATNIRGDETASYVCGHCKKEENKVEEEEYRVVPEPGVMVFQRRGRAIYPALICSGRSDDAGKISEDSPVDLMYFDANSSRVMGEKKVRQGFKDKNWWRDSKELGLAIEIELHGGGGRPH